MSIGSQTRRRRDICEARDFVGLTKLILLNSSLQTHGGVANVRGG